MYYEVDLVFLINFKLTSYTLVGPIARVSSLTGGDDTTMYVDHATRAVDPFCSFPLKLGPSETFLFKLPFWNKLF
jgi:hypothetical protein